MSSLDKPELKSLITGGKESPLLPELRHAIARARVIEISVAFVKHTGLDLIFADLCDFLASERFERLTFLTSDYLCVTDPTALRKLMLLVERGAEVKVHQVTSEDKQSFHLKAYIFTATVEDRLATADAFVGSSNISRMALTDGFEWNYRIHYPNKQDASAEARITEIRAEFNKLLEHPNVSALSYEWIEAYEQRYKPNLSPAQEVAPEPPPERPTPLPHQQEALQALAATRARDFVKGLVVLATGMGKTYLAAFDALQMAAGRVLFVAHREEILLQAEDAFQTLMPNKRIGRYTGKQKEAEADLIFASVQTLGRLHHLDKFQPTTFDYIVVDEFHHAAAGSYQSILAYFQPKFLLGLTATPDRSDRSDILKLCDHNLVYRRDLYDGIKAGQLCNFHYYGIFDADVDYEHIPWRNGRFDPERLSNKLATQARAKHIIKEWHAKAQARTLAFCASRKHADFMAEFFNKQGLRATSVHTESDITRSEALALLESGQIQVLFSVDLFNEGMDLPQIDTVLMLRPTESKILFMQQLGRGLRLSDTKDKLVVLDFVGNHHSFINRPELLFGPLLDQVPNRKTLRKLAENHSGLLPDGCFVNFDLAFVDFLAELANTKIENQYQKLKDNLGRRPTLLELWNSGASLQHLRQQFGCWWEFIDAQGDLENNELPVLEQATQWFRDLTVIKTVKAYKLILLQTLIDRKRLTKDNSNADLASWAAQWYAENTAWAEELPGRYKPLPEIASKSWQKQWIDMPISHWVTPESASGIAWFTNDQATFSYAGDYKNVEIETLEAMTAEILEWRMAQYQANNLHTPAAPNLPDALTNPQAEQLSYFPDIKIACGHFKTGSAEVEETVNAPKGHGALSPDRHFIARASGNSMNGGKNPIYDGDYLLLEQITPTNAGAISNTIVAIERQDETGDNQYLLRKVVKHNDGGYLLRAQNNDYQDMEADDSMVTFARLKGVVDPLEILMGREFMREDIPELFGEEFNPGNWQAGHIYLEKSNAQVLLVTLNKQGKQEDHQYNDYFADDGTFHWQSQNSTSPESAKGQRIINHEKLGSKVYLFVRDHKLRNKKAAPFRYYGAVTYAGHEGCKPMSVRWRM